MKWRNVSSPRGLHVAGLTALLYLFANCTPLMTRNVNMSYRLRQIIRSSNSSSFVHTICCSGCLCDTMCSSVTLLLGRPWKRPRRPISRQLRAASGPVTESGVRALWYWRRQISGAPPDGRHCHRPAPFTAALKTHHSAASKCGVSKLFLGRLQSVASSTWVWSEIVGVRVSLKPQADPGFPMGVLSQGALSPL